MVTLQRQPRQLVLNNISITFCYIYVKFFFCFYFLSFHPLLPHWTLLSSVFLSLLIFPVYVFLSVRLLLCPVSLLYYLCVLLPCTLCVPHSPCLSRVSIFLSLTCSPVPLLCLPVCLSPSFCVQCVQFCFPVSLCIIHSAVFPLPSLPSRVCMVSVFLVSLVGSSAFLASFSEFPVPCSMFSIYCLVLVRPVYFY